jgi:mannose-6-phosphate isomerase-like protein (cupin superfamily)
MSPGLLRATLDDPSVVSGVHGSPGRTRWACLASRRDLTSPCEAVEWASVPPGGLSGEHLHTRTEEIYFVVSGRGEVLLNGTLQPVRPGSVVLTGVGSTHGLRNTGTTDLDWLVIETLAPGTVAAVAGRPNRQGDTPVSAAVVIDMTEQRLVDTTDVFSGPLTKVEIVQVPPGTTHRVHALGAEFSVFTLHGSGTVRRGAEEAVLAEGVCVTLPLGPPTDVTAGPDALEIFVATLATPRAEGQL